MKCLNLPTEEPSEDRAPEGEERREWLKNGIHRDEDSTPSLSQVTLSSDSGSYEVTLQDLELRHFVTDREDDSSLSEISDLSELSDLSDLSDFSEEDDEDPPEKRAR